MKGLSFYWLDRLVAARRRIVLSVLLFSITPSFAEEAGDTGGRVAIRAGKVLTMDAGDTVINNAVVLVKGGAIEHIGLASDTTIPVGYWVINAQDKWVFPGIIDAHNHTAGSLMDLNDMVYLSNPGLRTLETILPDNERIKGARAGGVTTVLLIPGSGTNIYRNIIDLRAPVPYGHPSPDDEKLTSFGRLNGDHGGPVWEPTLTRSIASVFPRAMNIHCKT